MKIAKNVDAELLIPGAEMTFNNSGNLVPIPPPIPAVTAAYSHASEAEKNLDALRKYISNNNELSKMFTNGEYMELENIIQKIRETYADKLAKESNEY